MIDQAGEIGFSLGSGSGFVDASEMVGKVKTTVGGLFKDKVTVASGKRGEEWKHS